MYFHVKDDRDWLRIRKDAFVRLFNEPEFLSKDRNKRFIFKKKVNQVEPFNEMEIKHHSIIALSDWVLIKNFHGVARVLEFKDIHAKTISQGKIKVSA